MWTGPYLAKIKLLRSTISTRESAAYFHYFAFSLRKKERLYYIIGIFKVIDCTFLDCVK